MIRRTKQLNPDAIVVAVGCYAQVAKDKLEEIKDIDLILGISEKTEIVKYVKKKYIIESHKNIYQMLCIKKNLLIW